MLELILLSPLMMAVGLAGLYLGVWRKRPVTLRCGLGLLLGIAAAFALPAIIGVWPLDFFGQDRVIGQAESSSGHRIEIVQRWNFIDFYTTDAQIVSPDGSRSVTVLDGDDSKHWSSIPIQLGADGRSATISLRAGHSQHLAW